MNATPFSHVPVLNAQAFARAFPFYLHIDANLCVLSSGASLRKAYPAVQPGVSLQTLFTIRRPRAVDSIEAWRTLGFEACTLESMSPSHLAFTLRGSVEICDDGLLLLVSPVLTSLDEVTRLGLGFNDFARHDASCDSLLLAQTSRALKQDADRMAERLRGRTEQLTTILELSQSGVVYFDPSESLQHVNTALLGMLSLKRVTAFDLSIEALDDWIDGLLVASDACRRPLAALMGGQTDTVVGLMLQIERPRPAVIHLGSARTNDGGWVFYLRDVTHETEVDRMKSEFLETAAHELRTPMVSVYGFTELLLNRPVPEAQRRDMLETIHRQSKLLINMVNEMLDLRRIEARQGKDLIREPCRLGTLVDQAVTLFAQPELAERMQVHVMHADALLDLDAGKTLRALTNVLSNAFKYSSGASPITLDSLDGTLHGAAAVGLRVTDQGIGMTPDQQARVFERFYRADPSGNISGTGLGMSLVKEVIELHGGRVDFSSEAGIGTAVTLWWPLSLSLAAPK